MYHSLAFYQAKEKHIVHVPGNGRGNWEDEVTINTASSGTTFGGNFSQKEGLGKALQYYLLLLLLLSLLLVIGGIIIRPLLFAPYLGEYQYMGWLGIGLIVPFVLVQGFIGLVLGGVVLHPFVRLLGGNRGLPQTLKALAYGNTPLVLSRWCPPAMGITMMWAFILTVIGLRQTQGISTIRAVLSILLPLAVLATLSFVARMVL